MPAFAAPATFAVEPAAADAVAVVHAFGAALSAGETGLAGDFLDPGVVVVIDDRVLGAREDYLATHADAEAARHLVVGQPTHSLLARAGDGLAWVVSERAAPEQAGGVETETMVLARTPAGWKILHIHWSTRPSAAP